MPRNQRWIALLNAGFVVMVVGGVFAFNYVVDPFNANRAVKLPLAKSPVAFELNPWNWKLAEYERLRTPNVLLGDSRMDRLSVAEIENSTREKFYNFACGGATLTDLIETFWFCAERARLERVVVGVNFNHFNWTKQFNRVREARLLLEDPLRYYFNPFITQVSLRVLAATPRDPAASADPVQHAWERERSGEEKNEIWRRQLDVTAQHTYANFIYVDGLLDQWRTIADYCRQHDVQLEFVYFPSHADLQRLVDQAGLAREYQRSKADLRAIAPLWDYDYDNAITRDQANYTDPYHFSSEVARQIVDEVFGCKMGLAQRSTQPLSVKEQTE